MTEEQAARNLLSLFRARQIEAGQVLMTGYLWKAFQDDFGTADEFRSGRVFAAAKGWLSDEDVMIRLTETGFAESN